ncbi:MAG TPA: glycoside hydrolase family 3 C-terminal domain-containing protein [Candidatus Dormibacteraeota bacterium]|nr:glycoside hydrolase family 3 C-terminal domain-containing protein [Candidatus Dormibacteraeota bacterium]
MSIVSVGARGDESGLLARLTLEQKVRLLTGADSWRLYGESAVGLRPMVLSDGPAGVRGTGFDPANPSSSLPCPIALGATWDERLVHNVALALGREARGKGVDVLLAPTVNIVRTPLNGRGFECFSEDPVLSARIAVAYVRGVQEAGVAATVKHYVANDSETERRTYDALVTEGVLRELYLPPFEACVAEADVWLVMAAYNSVNGAFMTANRPLLHDLLKMEWGFQGVVVSDWSATYTTAPSAHAGLDLVMPGPRGPWGDQLVAEVKAGTVAEAEIDDKVSRLITLARRVGALNGSIDGDSHQNPARELVDPALLREVTTRSFVLLSNRRGLLPIRSGSLDRLALIGPNAVEPQTQGGGSVRVLPVAGTDLADSLGDALDTLVSVHQGCETGPTIAVPRDGSLRDPVSGEAGVRVEVRTADGAVVHDARFHTSVLTWWDNLPEAVHLPGSEIVMRARYRAHVDGPHMLGVAGVGQLRVLVDDALLKEVKTEMTRDSVQALSNPPEARVLLDLRAGREVEVRVEHRPNARGPEFGFATLRLGIAPYTEEDKLIADAVVAAAGADVAVVVVGSAEGTESEGYDRETMVLPGRQDELVQRVAAANTSTVVVVNSGMPVLMPWADEVAAIIQVWLPGQAFAEALADVIAGVAEPGGRLPVSVPRAEADSPVLSAHPLAGDLVYAEGLLVGYRGYDRKGTEALFSFGHGLGYTDWAYESIAPAAKSISGGDDLQLEVTVRNSGGRAGREVVQVYLEGPDDDPRRPLRVLAAFGTVDAEPGMTAAARLTVPARTFARFDEARREWVWPAGTYLLRAGCSSRDLRLSSQVVMR